MSLCLPGYLFPDPGRCLHGSLQTLSKVAAPVHGQVKAKTQKKKKQGDWPGVGHHSLLDDPCTAKAVFRLRSPFSEPNIEQVHCFRGNRGMRGTRVRSKSLSAKAPRLFRCCEQTEPAAHLAQFCPDVFGCLGAVVSAELKGM